MFEINLIIYNKGMAGPGGLPSMGWHRVRHDWSNLAAAAAYRAPEVAYVSIWIQLKWKIRTMLVV